MSQSGSYFGGGTPLPDAELFEGNTGGPVGPNANNTVFIVGTDPISVNGDPGAFTLTIDVDGATEAQIGVVEFATNAETILGLANDLAVHPQGLGAKLGAQTAFGLAYGNGSSLPIGWTDAGIPGQVLGNSATAPVWIGPAEDGEVLIGSSGGQPSWSVLNAGAGIEITNLPGEITITNTGGGGGGPGAQTFPTDDGTAVVNAGGILEILGDSNITTEGSGNTVEVTLNQDVTISGTYETTAGYFNLPATTNGITSGAIQWDGVNYIHTLGTNNIFAGRLSGNGSLTTASGNSSLGAFNLPALTTGNLNLVAGSQSATDLESGSFNTILGSQCASLLVSGSNNIIIGNAGGGAYSGAESSNILLGNVGVSGESQVMRLGGALINNTYIRGIFNTTPSSSARITLTDSFDKMSTAPLMINGELLIGSTGNAPVLGTITGGTNINVVNGPGSITINADADVPDYEAGTWTPVLVYNPSGTAPTYTVELANYIRINDLVFIEMQVNFSAKNGPGTQLVIQGLPFNPPLSTTTGSTEMLAKHFAGALTVENPWFLPTNQTTFGPSFLCFRFDRSSAGFGSSQLFNNSRLRFAGSYKRV